MGSTFYQDPGTLAALCATHSDRQIARMAGLTGPAIAYWRRKFGIANCPNPKIETRPPSLDPTFFAEIDSEAKAYILGFITADGYVHKNGRVATITVREDDVQILRDIATAMRCTNSIGHKQPRGGYGNSRPQRSLNLCSRELVADLAVYGVVPRKTYSMTFPNIPPAYEGDFIRGVLDGDGTIGHRQFSIVGTHDLLIGIQDAAKRHTGCNLSMCPTNGHARLIGSGRSYGVLHWLYSDATIFLHRKRQKYLDHWARRALVGGLLLGLTA